MTRAKVGDIILFNFDALPNEPGHLYLITNTRTWFRYEVIYLNEGRRTSIDKAWAHKHGRIIQDDNTQT
jgi:hypothetical protein